MENRHIKCLQAIAGLAPGLIGAFVLWLFCTIAATAQSLEIEYAQGPFEDERVRIAAFAAGDWKQIASQYGLNARYVVMRYENLEEWREQTPANLDKAKAIMAEAGFVDGLPTPVFIFHDQPTGRLAVQMGRALSTLGIQTEVQFVAPEDRASMVSRMRIVTGREAIEIPYIFLTTSRRAPPIVELTPLPDFVVGSPQIRFDAGTRQLGVQVTVENAGPGPAPPSEIAIIDHSGTVRFPPLIAPAMRPRSAANVNARVQIPDSMLGRVLELQAEVDPRKVLQELNERNNFGKSVPFKLPKPPARLPDLIVDWQGHRYDPDARRLAVQALIRNIGDAPAAANVTDVQDQSGAVSGRLLQRAVGPLKPGEDAEVTGIITLPANTDQRTLSLTAIVDAKDDVAEANERNNESRALVVQIPPNIAPEAPPSRSAEPTVADLVVTIPTAAVLDDGRSVDVSLKVVNRGTAPSAATTLILRVGPDATSAKLSVPALAPRRQWTTRRTVVPDLRAFGGSVDLLAIVDPADQIPESNEANNRFSRSVTVQAPWLIWGGIGLISFLVLTMAIPLVRARPKPRKRKADRGDEKPSADAIPVNLAYVPRTDAGYQQVDPEDGNLFVALEFSLRAVADPGSQHMASEGP